MSASRRGPERPRESGGDLIEGRHPITEALRAGVPVREILLAEGHETDPALGALLSAARERGTRVRTVRRADLDAMSARGVHQGVIAVAEPFRYSDLDAVLAPLAGNPRVLIVILDHVTDPGNLGAVLRSAEVAGAAAVVLPKARSAGVTPVAYKASAGAAAYLPVVRVANIAATLRRLKDASFWVAGASERARDPLWEAPLDGRLALVLGAEGEGLARLTERECDLLVRIPVAGRVSSLNVAQAATVLAFEWMRRGLAGPS